MMQADDRLVEHIEHTDTRLSRSSVASPATLRLTRDSVPPPVTNDRYSSPTSSRNPQPRWDLLEHRPRWPARRTEAQRVRKSAQSAIDSSATWRSTYVHEVPAAESRRESPASAACLRPSAARHVANEALVALLHLSIRRQYIILRCRMPSRLRKSGRKYDGSSASVAVAPRATCS